MNPTALRSVGTEMDLHACQRCQRHARASEAQCPFCGGDLARSLRPVRRVAQLTRAAVFYAGALAACSEPNETTEPTEGAEPTTLEVADQEAPSPMPSTPEARDTEVEPAYTGPVTNIELAPEPEADRRAERRHAEARKRPPRPTSIPVPIRIMPPYGAPPADFDWV